MSQGSPQFTPRQLLDAGRRAEAEGKLDYANQLYRHLADHYAYTAEAAEARNGLGRIGLGAGSGQQLWAENGAAVEWPGGPAHGKPSAGRSGPKVRPAATLRHYRTGRVLATLVSWIGWLIVAAGAALALLVIATDSQVIQSGFPYATSLGSAGIIGAAVAFSVAGLAVVFWGQMASALFDQANATRELVAMERARQAGDQG